MTAVSVRGLHKTYKVPRQAPVIALAGVDLELREGELLVVLGPSGSGKTTFLRSIAGLDEPDAGTVEIAGRDVTSVPPGQRDVAMVFQEYALFPHLDVRSNIAFGLKARKKPAPEVESALDRVTTMLGLDGLLHRRPSELSGGERQRVALARAVVRQPQVFLLDEPLSQLDAELRIQTRTEIRALQKQLGTAMVYVTHDQTEALTIGDRVAIMRSGRVEQVGEPMELYHHPASAFVARFVGQPAMNLFPATLAGGTGGDGVILGVRPEHLKLVEPGRGRFEGHLIAVERLGSETIVHVEVEEHRLAARSEPFIDRPVGSKAGLDFSDAHVHRFESLDGPALP